MPRPYRESLLAPGERIALITRPHALTFWGGALRGLILGFVLLAVALVVEQSALVPPQYASARPLASLILSVMAVLSLATVVLAWARWRAHEIVVTDRRVIRIAGMLSKDVIDYSLDAITDMRLRQSWIGRMLGYGDVDILTASEVTSRPRETFPTVAGPIQLVHAIEQCREARRRGYVDPSQVTMPLGPPR